MLDSITGTYKAVVVGASAGGMDAISKLLSALPASFPLPIVVVQHLHPSSGGYLVEHFERICVLPVREPEDKEEIQSGTIYLAPANYHLLIETDETFSLSIDERVSHSRPSIDVLFESAAIAWGGRVIGVLLTGANSDGASGLCLIKSYGGLALVQDPATAGYPVMPQAAIDAGCADQILSIEGIAQFLYSLVDMP